MKLKVTKNAKKGIIFGSINKIALLLLPFLVQTAMIHTLGAEYLGIKGLFTSILQVFSLAELGFGSAIVYSMYKPIADGDTKKIQALLLLYRIIYRIIGLFILVIGIVLLPFLPKLINGGYPDNLNIYIIFFLYLINTVLSYWLFAYRSCLFTAFQRTDITSIIHTVASVSCYILQIAILFFLRNYYLYLLIAIISTVLNNLLVYYCSKYFFPGYTPEGEIDRETKKEITEKVKGLLVYKVCGVTRNSFDNIFVSMFLGLNITAMYSNYFYVISSVSNLMGVATSSLLAGIGNKMKLYSSDSILEDMMKLDVVYMIIAGWCTTSIVCLFQPFMEIWVGKEMLFPFSVAALFGVYFYLLKMGDIRALYSDAAGLWWENRYRTLMEAVSNIILNYTLVKLWGVYGIIIATIITIFLFGYLGSATILFKKYFKKGLNKYYLHHFGLLLANLAVCSLTFIVCTLYTGSAFFNLIYRSILCCVLSPMLYFIMIYFSPTWKASFKWLLSKIKQK